MHIFKQSLMGFILICPACGSEISTNNAKGQTNNATSQTNTGTSALTTATNNQSNGAPISSG